MTRAPRRGGRKWKYIVKVLQYMRKDILFEDRL